MTDMIPMVLHMAVDHGVLSVAVVRFNDLFIVSTNPRSYFIDVHTVSAARE
jgi:hypothetical protein